MAGVKPRNMLVQNNLDEDVLDLDVPQAAVTDPDALTSAALTDNSGGSDTPDGTIAEIANIALSTSNTYTDAAVNAAVNAVVDDCANAIEECADQINKLVADVASLHASLSSVIAKLEAAGIISA